MRATELDREPIEGRTELEGRRMAKLATRGGREGAKQNWIEQQESNVVHLWIGNFVSSYYYLFWEGMSYDPSVKSDQRFKILFI